MSFEIDDEFVLRENRKALAWLDEDYAHLGRQLARRGVEIEPLVERAIGPGNLRPAISNDIGQRQHSRSADATKEIGFVFCHLAPLLPKLGFGNGSGT